VRTCLDQLEAEGIMRPCDPDIVATRIKRADRTLLLARALTRRSGHQVQFAGP
jgi:hypothetical protein